MMTARDYEATATGVRSFRERLIREGFTDGADTIARLAARAIADELMGTNPKFNRDRFITACDRIEP